MGVSKPINDGSVLLQQGTTVNGTSDEVTVSIGAAHVYTVDISAGTASVQLQHRPYGFSNYRNLGAAITAVTQTTISYDCAFGGSYRDVVTGIGGGAVVTSSFGYAGGK
jgi:hypothetical protein